MKQSLPKVIYVMGPPGAGKGTQAKLLCQKISYHNFSTGNAFREVAMQDTPLGHRVKETIDNGFLAPPEMAAEIVITAVSKYVPNTGLVFDGTPRTVKESEIVDDYFVTHGAGRPLVIHLALNKEEMIRRNSERKFCLGVSGGFPVMTEQDSQRCQSIGGTIGIRPDDEPEKFNTRWEEFMNQTYPVIARYTQQGMVTQLDGMQSIAAVHRDIMAIIDTYQEAHGAV